MALIPAFLFWLWLLTGTCHGNQHIKTNQALGRYKSIFSFGDSLADTGNFYHYSVNKGACGSLPYGETYFHKATGRCSNGRLIIDFIAQGLGLPLVPPYLGHQNQKLVQGINFAVAGGTALDSSYFRQNNITVNTNYTLEIQLGWFKQALPSLCASPSLCQKMMKESLFLVGEIGGNDVNHPLRQRKSLKEVKLIVPKAVAVISSTITSLIKAGATTLIVPGNFPIGCSPQFLTIYLSKNKDDYEPTGCLKSLNEFARYQNNVLKTELDRLRKAYPHARIIYGDYYNLALELIRSPKKFGLRDDILQTCCGGKGPYSFNLTSKCGSPGSTVCPDPSKYVHWDGNHWTEAAYKHVAAGLLHALLVETA